MQTKTKASLLNALVFPGIGQCVLKRYVRGAIFISATLAALVILVHKLMILSAAIKAEILSSNIPPDIATLVIKFSQDPIMQNANQYSVAIITVWMFSIIDSLLIPQKAE